MSAIESYIKEKLQVRNVTVLRDDVDHDTPEGVYIFKVYFTILSERAGRDCYGKIESRLIHPRLVFQIDKNTFAFGTSVLIFKSSIFSGYGNANRIAFENVDDLMKAIDEDEAWEFENFGSSYREEH